LNKASNLKLCWSLTNSQATWAILLRDRVFRKGKAIQYHIFSSIWSSIKEEFEVIRDNSVWLLGNGADINFWLDNWCGVPIAEQLGIPMHIRRSLSASVSDFISNGQWNIPRQLSLMFRDLTSIVSNVAIPMEPSQDKLIWKHTDTGDLELKQAYCFNSPQFQEIHWAKNIWNAAIPPSKSLLVWRLMHGKVPTDENLMLRGCEIPSMCNLCNSHVESSFHLFFECHYAIKLWSWLAGCLNSTLQFYSMEDIWKLCDLNWSPQSKVTITAAIIHLLNTLWFVRNQSRLNNTIIPWQSAISFIIASTSLSGNTTGKTSSNSIRDFSFLKKFRISIHHPRPSFLKEVIWHPPLLDWYKCNIDGASCGNPGNASCGGIFRNYEADFVYGFAEPLGINNAYVAELCGAMRAIEIAFDKQWTRLWIETDSLSVVSTFNRSDRQVAWSLRNRWNNVILKARQMNVIITHIYREGNQVADSLANYGLSLTSIVFWDDVPLFVRDSFIKNKQGIPSFRVCLA
jgi:ribonuclease HI